MRNTIPHVCKTVSALQKAAASSIVIFLFYICALSQCLIVSMIRYLVICSLIPFNPESGLISCNPSLLPLFLQGFLLGFVLLSILALVFVFLSNAAL